MHKIITVVKERCCNRQDNLASITCFECKRKRHNSDKCPERIDLENINNINKHINNSGLDSEIVLINGVFFNLIFYEVANESIFTLKSLGKLGKLEIFKREKIYGLVNGTKINTNRDIELNIRYRRIE